MTYSLRFELLCDLLNDQGSFNCQNILPPGFFTRRISFCQEQVACCCFRKRTNVDNLTDLSDQIINQGDATNRESLNKWIVVASIQELNVDHLSDPSDKLLTSAMRLIMGH